MEAEMDEEEQEGDVGNVGGAIHPEDWKYSRVGTDSAAAPSVPPVSDEWRMQWHDTCESEQQGS